MTTSASAALSYRSNSIEEDALPWVRDLRVPAYPKLSASGILARTDWMSPSPSMLLMGALRLPRSPSTSPRNSPGVAISSFMTGSNRNGPALSIADLVAMDPAIRKAISDESTS